jgi:hypothetical protein
MGLLFLPNSEKSFKNARFKTHWKYRSWL